MPEDTTANRLVETRDGSHTVYSPQFDQHYHNPNGAIAESRYVFFGQTGLPDRLDSADSITILEVGFGTGLNLMLLLDYYREHHSSANINYYSVEGFPLDTDVARQLNFSRYLNYSDPLPVLTDIFSNLSKGMNRFEIDPNIMVHLFYGMFDHFDPAGIEADYIFHDAFSPDVNSDLWTGEVFQKLKKYSANDVILSTYCAASKARGAMAWAGWKVARAQGALGKREMSLAALHPDRLGDLKRINEERLAHRYEEDDF